MVPTGDSNLTYFFTGVIQLTSGPDEAGGLLFGILLIYPNPAKLNDPEMAVERIS
jgi:hypothetical protein